MGNLNNKPTLSEAEQSITSQEQHLGFSQHTSSHIDSILRCHSLNSMINEEMFDEVVELLELVDVYADPPSKFSEFYKNLQTDDSYKLTSLGIIGILLGKDEVVVKAKLLFELFDLDQQHRINREKVIRMCREVTDIAIHRLPVIAKGTVLVDSYIHMCSFQQRLAEANLMERVLGDADEITPDKFVDAFRAKDMQAILSSHGARSYFAKFWKIEQTHRFYIKHPPEKFFIPEPVSAIKVRKDSDLSPRSPWLVSSMKLKPIPKNTVEPPRFKIKSMFKRVADTAQAKASK